MKYLLLPLISLFASSSFANDDPLADRNVTCEEMARVPEQVFKLRDLGSGMGSPNTVDYSCPKSLNQLEFLKPLLQQSGSIREPSQLPQFCTGTIVYAQWRYYHFDLARLGYYPQGASKRVRKTQGLKYFEEWGYQSINNREQYKNYIAELDRVAPLLIDWYMENHAVDKVTAEQYTDLALTTISNYGFGSYYYSWQPEALVSHTQDAVEGDYGEFIGALADASDLQRINSLRRMLVHDAPDHIIRDIVESLNSKSLNQRSESPISLAIMNGEQVQILLKAGFDPNHQNEFGKTPLYYAIQYNQHASALRLLEAGAEVNHTYQLEKENKWNCLGINQWGRTPLMHAAQHSDTDMLKMLLEKNANPILKDVLGSIAADYAKNHGNIENELLLRQFVKAKNDGDLVE